MRIDLIQEKTGAGMIAVLKTLPLIELTLIFFFVFVPTFVLSLFLSVLSPITIFVEIVLCTSVQYTEKTLLGVVIYACNLCTHPPRHFENTDRSASILVA